MNNDPELARKQYLQIVEQRIGETFANNGIFVNIEITIAGPHTITTLLRLYEPTARNVTRALALGGSVESTLRTGPVRIYKHRGLFHVELPAPQPTVVYSRALAGKGLNVPVGLNTLLEQVEFDFDIYPHLMLIGATKAGKTTAAQNIAYQLARQNRPSHVAFLIFTFDPDQWTNVAGLPHCRWIVDDPDESVKAIHWLHYTMLQRQKSGNKLPHLFVFADDMLALIDITDTGKIWGRIASMGRKANIHEVLNSQMSGERGMGDVSVVRNIRTRIVYGAASSSDAYANSGQRATGAETIGQHPGDCLLVIHGEATRCAGALPLPEDFAALGYPPIAAGIRPWNRTPPPPPPAETAANTLILAANDTTTTTGRDQQIRQLFARGESKSRIALKVFGYKDSATLHKVDQALGV